MKWYKHGKIVGWGMLCLFVLVCLLVVFQWQSMEENVSNNFRPVALTSSENSRLPYQSPVDFKELTEINPHIYAWIDIPGTNISYPVLQHSEDDSFYLTHDVLGRKSAGGSLFSEKTYNGTDFDDPVTVIYGHSMKSSGTMFSELQEYYSNAETFDKYNEIIVYLPNRELHFEVFAAIPYDNRHLLYQYDFTNNRIFRLFFDDILSVRSITANIPEGAMVQNGKQVLILSTCLIGNKTERFLICAKIVKEEGHK